MNTTANRIIELFSEAAAKPSFQDREHFLATACANDPSLRAQLDSLLQAHDAAGGFLRQSLGWLVPDVAPEKPGTVIGRYKLIRRIGEGGCGVVFEAEQQEPLRRVVALKVIKSGMDTRSVIARFEIERQTLALMHHPGIAMVFDAGATETGRPYFVMELVRGTPVTNYVEAERRAGRRAQVVR